jgi:hypothetical protein
VRKSYEAAIWQVKPRIEPQCCSNARTNELYGFTAAVAAARIGRISLCHLKKWRPLKRKGTLVGYTTNRMVHNSRGRRSWEVFGSVSKATFRWDDHPCYLESFRRARPRLAIQRPWSSLREFVPDLPKPGLSPKDSDTFRDFAKCASGELRNRQELRPRLLPRMSARRTKPDAA